MLSTGNSRKNDGLDALATALAASRNDRLAAVDPGAASEVLSLLSERRLFWWPNVEGGSRQPAGFYEISSPAGWPERSAPSGRRASCAPYDREAPPRASAADWLRRSCA